MSARHPQAAAGEKATTCNLLCFIRHAKWHRHSTQAVGKYLWVSWHLAACGSGLQRLDCSLHERSVGMSQVTMHSAASCMHHSFGNYWPV